MSNANKRIAAGLLSASLLLLLGWCLLTGAGNARTSVTLGIGALLGVTYTALGKVPEWIIKRSKGKITDDDDPSNIPAKIYLPILLAVVVFAAMVFVLAIQML